MEMAGNGVKWLTIEAKIIRADGTIEDLGTLAEYHAPEPETCEHVWMWGSEEESTRSCTLCGIGEQMETS